MKDDPLIDALRKNYSGLKVVEACFPKLGGWNSFMDKLLSFWFNYFRLCLSGLRSSNKSDTIITWQVFVGVMTGLIMKALGLKRRLVVMSFIYRPRKSKVANKLRFLITKLGLSSAWKVVCYSQHEVSTYSRLFGFQDARFCFVQLGKTFTADHLDLLSTNGQIFSAGQSNRDYETLIESMCNVDARLLIATTNSIPLP